MDDDAVENFWNIARERAGLNNLEVPLGPSQVGTVPPPTWSFGDTADEADDFVAGLLDEGSGELTTPMSDYAESGAEEPAAGDLSIVLDGDREPRALVTVAAVAQTDGVLTQQLTVLYPA